MHTTAAVLCILVKSPFHTPDWLIVNFTQPFNFDSSSTTIPPISSLPNTKRE